VGKDADVSTEQGLRLVAHRAGNDLARLAAAERAGADLIEADVYLFRGRLEIRHARTLGPWWSRRWETQGAVPHLIPVSVPRIDLPMLMAAAHPSTRLMLDLKGSPAVGAAVWAAWRRLCPGRELTVSARAWSALDAFPPSADAGVTRVLSAGSRRQVARVARRAHAMGAAIGIAAPLLDADTGAALRSATDALFCWGLESAGAVALARTRGATHVILDDLSLAAGLR
jgi:glycerophosphoryl diester phosphodiesterase